MMSMDSRRILAYLRAIKANNNREWFLANKEEYNAVRAEWEYGVGQAIERIVTFDPSVGNQRVKDCTYRFNCDTRFSVDKSPYKSHFGAYINAKGKKALRGGYYLHLEPNHCLLAVGNYWLPTNILTSCRNEIMTNEELWLQCVESSKFIQFFGADYETREWNDSWDSKQGFGLTKLKKCPSGFPSDYQYVNYLRLKDYCAWHSVNETFFGDDKWLDGIEEVFRTAKPMMDFVNSVIDDYE